MDVLEKITIVCHCREQKDDASVVQPIVYYTD